MPRTARPSPPTATDHLIRPSLSLLPLLRRSLPALLSATLLAVGSPLSVRAQSALLESVKQNPALAQSLCQQFRQLNAQGVSATSKASIASLASSRGLSPVDAEVLATYVIGLHCSTVF